jgi:hypothetical protein
MKARTFLLTAIFTIICSIGFAQYTVEGTVNDESGNPISGVNVRIKNSKNFGVNTDISGYFIYTNIPSDTLSLIFSFEGTKNVEEKINHRNKIDIVMYFDVVELGDTIYKVPLVVDSIAYDPEIELVAVDDMVFESYSISTGDVSEVAGTETSTKRDSWFGSDRSLAKGESSSAPKSVSEGYSEYRESSYEESIILSDKTKKSTEDYEYEKDISGAKDITETGDDGINSNIRSGMLTAGEIHDFSKWDLWNDITVDQLSQYKTLWEIYPLNRYCVQLTSDDGKPLIDSKVELKNNNGDVLWTAHTDNTGKAELWGGMFDSEFKEDAGYYISINHQKTIFSIDNPKKFHEGINILSVKSECNIPNVVDIAFVVDATGSMSDEINYLKVELQDIIERAGKDHPDLTFNLGSVFYRDAGDSYLTIKSDLNSNIKTTIDFIKAQYAGGGGDFPEAVDDGLQTAINELTWSENAIAKMCFLVLDAPPHDNPQVKEKLEKLTIEAAAKGIRIIPVTCSGIDKSTEYLMRSMALATNGTYVFLTDDSGIGGSHIAPTTDEWTVEYLNDLIIRLINQYTLTPTCDNQLPVTEENLQDTAYLVIEAIEPILDINLNNPDSSDVVDINNINPENPDLTDTLKNGQETDIVDVPYDYSKGIKYYPNPTQGELYIELEGEIKELYLADNSGKLLERYIIEDEELLELNLGSYPSGMYFIQYLNKDQWKAGQVILIRN